MPTTNHMVLAMTGASGSAYAIRLAHVLLQAGQHLHLVVSTAARQVAERELQTSLPGTSADGKEWQRYVGTALTGESAPPWGFSSLPGDITSGEITVHASANFSAGIASGSFLTRGMVICPCSMGTLSSVSAGASSNLIQRAADVHLKERRPLILVPRETPLSMIGLENMLRLTQAGATILPAMPGLYHQPRGIGDLVDFVVARICDHLHIPHQLVQRWGDS